MGKVSCRAVIVLRRLLTRLTNTTLRISLLGRFVPSSSGLGTVFTRTKLCISKLVRLPLVPSMLLIVFLIVSLFVIVVHCLFIVFIYFHCLLFY